MASSTDVESILSIYTSYLARQKKVPKSEAGKRIQWLRDFSHALGKRKSIHEISTRDVVTYFAEWAPRFADPCEWYERYKVLEKFFDDLVEMRMIEQNRIKGLYDDTDIEPDLLTNCGPTEVITPVNWSRQDAIY